MTIVDTYWGDCRLGGQSGDCSATQASKSLAVGIDMGSATVKAVVLDIDRRGFSWSVARMTTEGEKLARGVLERLLQRNALHLDDVGYVVATGYGRFNVGFAQEGITEISCLGRGMGCIAPQARTVLDIGGQDCKVIRLSSEGRIVKFEMNDKCAAGTGRYLERIARALDVKLGETGPLSLQARRIEVVSSLCTVFAEREVLQLLRSGKNRPDILAGAFASLARQTASLVRKVGIEEPFYVVGGVAMNSGVVKAIGENLGVVVKSVDTPQVVSALGAALFASERLLDAQPASSADNRRKEKP